MCFLQSWIAIAVGVETWVSKLLNLILKSIDCLKVYEHVVFVEEEFVPSSKQKV